MCMYLFVYLHVHVSLYSWWLAVIEYVCTCVVHNLHVRSSVSSISGSNVSGDLSVET